MDERLYERMNWARIEALVYSEEDQPHDILGPHVTEDGILIQAFIPTAEEMTVETSDGDLFPMEKEDDNGFFAVLIPGKTIPAYRFFTKYNDGSAQSIEDPYRFGPLIPEKALKKWNAGIAYDIYENLGAHPMTVDGVKGVQFAVWAPNAIRVSLVGDFNLWDGRRLPMRRRPEYGVFELFVPELAEGTLYKYEIKAKGGLTFLKADPFANAAELRPNTASVVTDLREFEWTDSRWLEQRACLDMKKEPLFVYELHLGSFKKPEDGRTFYNYRELAPIVAEYVRKMGYTHVELMPVMEHPLDETFGYQTTGYYAPTARYGTPRDFMCFVNYLHMQGIGVILDWSASHFPRDTFGLCGFDGTCLYEHHDPRQGVHPQFDTLLYNYGRPEVKNFLIANALFWTKVYHADGIRLDSVASMLYLDYGKSDGQWVANMYGGNENLEAVEFLKHLSSVFHRQEDGALLIAEESTAWPRVTGALDEDGLGFDFKWNGGWSEDFISYMQLDPIFRGYHHGDLTFSMVYHYSEEFMLALSHDLFVSTKDSLLSKMPGRKANKLANLRAAIGYMTVHPGKKLLFMGQDFAQSSTWKLEKGLIWKDLEDPAHEQIRKYTSDLVRLYRSLPALYELDDDPDGFEWINSISANENMLVFLRKGEKEEDTLLIVCNFSSLTYEKHKIGVPFAGKYKEIFNSDKEIYGGSGHTNPRQKLSKKDECDGRPDSVYITVPPLGVCIFSCTKAEKNLSENSMAKEARKTRRTGSSKSAKTVPEGDIQKAGKAEDGKTGSGSKPSLKERLARKVEEEENA